MTKRLSTIIAIVLIAILLGFLFVKREGNHESKEATTANPTATSTGTGSFSATQAIVSYTIADRSNEPVKVQPPTGVLARVATSSNAATTARIKVLQRELTANPNSLSDWLELGVLYKNCGDYEGARLSWEYAGVIRPTNAYSFINLGDLYQYYLKDFPKAEVAINTAIKNDPTLIDGYLRLFNLYSLSYKTETTLAAEALRKGIERNPEAVMLMIALGDYYKGREAYELAKTSYEQALTVAKKTNNQDQVKEITNLLAALP